MGISGRVGAAAAQGLDDLIVQQLAQQRFQEQMRAQQEQESLQREQMGLRERQFSAEQSDRRTQTDALAGLRRAQEAALQRQAEGEATAGRARANMGGVVDMMGQGMDPETAMREIAGVSARSGVEAPKTIADLFKRDDAKAPKRIWVTRRGAGPQYLPEDQVQAGDAPYEKPERSGGSPDQEWVIRDGQPTPIPKGSARPGDRPYDAVSARKEDGSAGPSPYSAERAQRTLSAVDNILGDVSHLTAGMGSLTTGIPGSPARSLQGKLNTLKSNIAFGELTAMREASKTGGALGAISERELTLLESALGSLDQGLNPEELKTSLRQIKESVQNWQAAQAGARGGANPPGPVRAPAPGVVPPQGGQKFKVLEVK